ncbi:Cna B-type domain-containing protein [Enterococcus hailinensis]|uniref:Cna B-type domain-containing protein n=1 Tax=Enterococcus hailinensis TaxID=3238988 RepID=UPI0038B24FDA
MNSQRKTSTYFVTLFTILVTLLPLINYVTTGIKAVAATTSPATTLFENQYGSAKVSYEEDPDQKHLDWTIEYSKITSELARQIGFRINSANQMLVPEKITSDPSNVFALDTSNVDQSTILQTKATKEASQGKIFFQTAYITSLSIQALENEFQTDGTKNYLLADQEPIVVSIPAKETQTTESKSSIANSVSTNAADQTTEVSSATVVENNPKKSKTENTTTTLPANSTSATSNSSATSETKTQETTADTKAAAKVESRVRVASAAASEETARDITTLTGSNKMVVSKTDGKTIFDSATLTKDGKTIDQADIQLNDNLLLQYNWSLPEDLRKNIKTGDYFNFKIPDKFTITAEMLSGNLSDSNGNTFGTFTINKDGTAKITFTKAVETNSGIKGTLNVAGVVNETQIDNPGKTEITVPFTDDDKVVVPIITVPDAKALSKRVVSQTDNKDIKDNQAVVTWEITANKTGNVMTNGVLTDTLPAGVTYKGNLKVVSYDVSLKDGTLIKETEKSEDITEPEITDKKITLNLPTSKKAHVITFDTDVDLNQYSSIKDPEQLTAAVKNSADLSSVETGDVNADATVTFSSASSIAKSGTGITSVDGKSVANWTIAFRKSGIDLPAGTKFVDQIGQSQSLTDEKGDAINEEALQTLLQAEFTANGKNEGKTISLTKDNNQTYSLVFPEGISDSFDLTLHTSVTGADTSYSNKINWHNQGNEAKNKFENPGSGIVKTSDKGGNGTILSTDKNDGNVTWTVKVNSEHKSIDSWQVVDTLENAKYNKDDIKIEEVEKSESTPKEVSKDFTIDYSDTSFTLNYKKKTTSEFIITYSGTYAASKLDQDISNTAVYHYTQNGKTWTNDAKNDFKTPGDQRQAISLSKGGTYNAVNNTVGWEINVNTGNVPYGKDGKLTDKIPADQTYNNDAKVEDSSGKEVTGLKTEYKDETLTVSGFPAGAKDNYKIVFTTKVNTEKDQLAVGSAKNTAEYTDNLNKPSSAEATVEYTKNENYVSKNQSYDPAKDSNTVHYAVTVNPGKLPLKNVRLVDSDWHYLKMLPETLKITNSAGEDVTTQFKTSIAEQEFSINFGDITDQYTVTYDMSLLFTGNPNADLSVSNTATITGDNVKADTGKSNAAITVKVPAAGGTAQGEVRSLKLKKVNSDKKNAPIKDAQFSLYRGEVAAGNAVRENVSTDENGEILFSNLTYGDYYIVETKAADGYYISNELKKGKLVTIDENTAKDSPKEVTLENTKVGAITLTKVDSTDPSIKLAKATFELYQDGKKVTQNALDESIDTFATNDQGVVTIPSLIPGDYVLKEVGAPEGYHVSTSDTAIAVKAGETTETTVKNTINQGKIELQKESADNKKLKGADFTLIDTTDASKKIVKTKTTDEHGLVDFELQANHTYKIKETKNPTGYEGSYELTGIKVTDEGKIVYTDQSGKEQTFTSSDTPIVVTNNRIVTTIKGTKTWKDADNKFGSRPNSVNVQLMQDGQVYATKNVTKADNWSYEFTDLPVIAEGGHRYNYTVKETNVAANYQAETNGNNITNTLKTTSVSGEKTWNDKDNQYNLRPSSIKVQLLQDKTPMTGAEYTKEVKVDQNGKWDYTFTGLPKYDSEGHEYNYSVQEIEENKNYTSTVTGMDLANKLATTKVSVDKTWNDQDNTYKTRPKNLTATLMVKQANGWKTFKEVFGSDKSIELNQANNWKGDFDNLPVYDKEQNQVQYGVKEELSTNTYTPNGANEGEQQVTVAAVAGISHLTNNLNTVAVTVNKTWKDFDNKFNTRPNEITFQFYAWTKDEADAEKFGTADRSSGEYTIKGNEQHQFSPLTISGLPKYDQNGNEMHYKVKEINIQKNYQATPNYSAKDNSLSIENILETTDVTINKQWDDQGNQAFERPEVTLQLFRQVAGSDAEAMPGADYTKTIKAGSKADSWSYTFKNLPKKDSTGNVYSYSVKETSKDSNYQASQVDPLTVKNTLITKQVRVVKHWEDFDNKYNSRPDEIEFNLMYKQDGQERAFMDINQKAVTKSIKVAVGNDWSYTFDKLPVKDAQGNDYTYDVQEVLKKAGKVITPNYTSENLGTTMNNTLRVITVDGKKQWDDQDNKFNSRPTSIKVQLLQNGKVMSGDEYIQEVKVNGDGTWSYAFDKLPELDTNGEKYVYTVKELDVPKNYQATEAGMDITNKLITTSFAGDKVWVDQDDRDKIRPTKVTIVLLQNGKQIAQTETSAKEKWHYRFEKLAKYDRKGDRYDYTVKELNVPKGYQSSVEGHTIINRHTLTPPTSDTPKDHLPTTKGGTGKTDAKMYPQTNDKNQAIWMIIGVVIILLVIMIWFRKRKSK